MITRYTTVLLLLLAGCPADDEVPVFTVPPPDDGFILGAAGAPQPTFGLDTTPTFEAGFQALAADGFNRFVPVFLTDESGQGTNHSTYFTPKAAYPESVFGPVDPSITCDGPSNPFAAARGHLAIDMPTYLLIQDQPVTSTIDPAIVRDRHQAFLRDCLQSDASVLGGLYLYDEPSNNHMTSECCDQDPQSTYQLDNVTTLAAIGKAELHKPTLLIEAPVPWFLPRIAGPWGIPGDQVEGMIDNFSAGVLATAPAADLYGFDVYPVDFDPDFSPVAEYVGHAREVAPQGAPVAVLQGFGAKDMGIDLGTPGRRPERAETRAMAMLAGIAGARAIYWYGQSAIKTTDSLWDDVREVARDLRRLSGIFALPAAAITTSRADVHVAGFRGKDATFVVVAEAAGHAGPVTLTLEHHARQIVDVLTGETVAWDVGPAWTADIGAYESHVLAVLGD